MFLTVGLGERGKGKENGRAAVMLHNIRCEGRR
jgi:hypothetical protein